MINHIGVENMRFQRYITASFVLCFNGVSSSYLAFTNIKLTRNEAQHCCMKHGMTLMTVKNQKEQYMVEKQFLPAFGYSGEFWIGVFSDETTADIYDASKQIYTWSNWDESSLSSDNIGKDGTYYFKTYVCAKGDLSKTFRWVLTKCEERLPYVCRTSEKPEANIVDIGDQSHVICPDILRYRSADVIRGGNSNINGSTYSGTYGTFTKEEQVTASSVKLESHEVTTFQDCIVLCTIHAKCNEVEFISDKICILYNSGLSTVTEQKAESKSSILTEQKLMSKG